MARKASKRAVEEVTLGAPAQTAPAATPEAEDGGLPLPEGAAPEMSGITAPALTAEPVDEVPAGLQLEDVEVAPRDVTRSRAGTLGSEYETVRMRALCDLDFSPTFGKYCFDQAVGRDMRTGVTVRGKVRNGFVYNVPRYVCQAMIEREWGMQVN